MSDTRSTQEVDHLTDAELAELRSYLPLLRALKALINNPDLAVRAVANRKPNNDFEPTPEDYAELRARRRKRAHRRGTP